MISVLNNDSQNVLDKLSNNSIIRDYTSNPTKQSDVMSKEIIFVIKENITQIINELYLFPTDLTNIVNEYYGELFTVTIISYYLNPFLEIKLMISHVGDVIYDFTLNISKSYISNKKTYEFTCNQLKNFNFKYDVDNQLLTYRIFNKNKLLSIKLTPDYMFNKCLEIILYILKYFDKIQGKLKI